MSPLTPSERRRRALRAIRAARKRRGLQRDEHVERVIGSLAELQQQIVLELQGHPSDFDVLRLDQLQREVDAHFKRWDRRARGLITTSIEEAWALGPDLVDAPFIALDSPLPKILLPDHLLDELLADGVKYMEGVGKLGRKRVSETLELGLLGGKSPDEVMREISASLKGPGPFRLVAFRAEVVTRTEMGRVHSKAGQRRLEDAARSVPGLGKQWIWSGKSRTAHAAVNNQVRAVDEAFDVGGEQLKFPRDPAGSAANTVMCACDSVPWMESWAPDPTDTDTPREGA